MSFQFNAYSLTLLMSGVAALLMSLVIFERPIAVVKWFSFMMLCSAVWAICYALELSSHTLEQMLFWIDLEYLGISFIPAAWIVFIIKFIGKNGWLTVIFSFPVLALGFVWTNRWHHIHYSEVSVDGSGPFPLLAITPGPWYHVHTVYFYFLLAWGVYLLIRKFRRSDAVFKRQNRSILIGAFIPWSVNLIYLLGLRPYHHLDLTPYAFIITSIVMGFGLLRLKLFDVVPKAREKVIEGIREGMLVLDAQGRVVDQNAPMEKFLRQYAPSTVGIQLDQIIPLEHKLHLVINKHVNDNLDIKLKDEEGDRYFEVAITPLFENETAFSGTLLIFWDITERKQAEEKLQKQADEMIILNQLKDRLFSVVSHDIRSPIAGLKGLLKMAEEGNISEEEFKSLLPTLSKDVGYTSDMLENLLQWSRSQLQGESIRPENVDLKSLSREKLRLFENRALEKKISLNDGVAESTFLWADQAMIGMVLQNLIGNAIKFCNPGDSVTIAAEADGVTTTISVRDTGIGIAEEKLKQLFGFHGVTTRGTKGEKGTGIGLRLCKDFVEKNDGKIWADSIPGQGSCFYFRLKTGIVGNR